MRQAPSAWGPKAPQPQQPAAPSAWGPPRGGQQPAWGPLQPRAPQPETVKAATGYQTQRPAAPVGGRATAHRDEPPKEVTGTNFLFH